MDIAASSQKHASVIVTGSTASAITKDFPGGKGIKEGSSITIPGYPATYEGTVNKKDYIYNKDGKCIKSTKG